MPWQERCAIYQRRLFVGDYLTGLWTMTQLCEQFAISRKTGYKWLGRYDTGGRPALADQSRRPHGHPAATSDRVVQRLLETRARFPRWSMGKVVTWLRRRYPRTAWPCRTTAYDLMGRAGVARAPKRPGPTGGRPGAPGRALTEPTTANSVWTTDFKGKFLLGNATYCHPFTLRDGFSRFVLRCDGVPAESYPCTRPLFERAFAAFGLPECIRSDNGTPFASTGLAGLSRLSVWWMQLGIRVERIEPGCPEQNGSHEQFHRVLKRDTTRPPGPTAPAQQRRFDAFPPRVQRGAAARCLGRRVTRLALHPITSALASEAARSGISAVLGSARSGFVGRDHVPRAATQRHAGAGQSGSRPRRNRRRALAGVVSHHAPRPLRRAPLAMGTTG
jgi:putative transposase